MFSDTTHTPEKFSEYLLTLFFRVLASSHLSSARRIGKWLTPLFMVTNNDLKKISTKNIELVYPTLDSTQKEKLLRDTLESTLIGAFEMPVIWGSNQAKFDKLSIEVIDEHLFIDAVQQKKGVIAICPHVGNWEVFGRLLTRYGSVTSLYQPPKLSVMEQLVKQGRQLSGATLVPTDQRGIAALLRALKKGEITGILPDQVPDKGSGEFAKFFERDAYTMKLVHKLVQKTACKVVLGYARRSNEGFEVIYKEAPEDIYSADSQTSLRALNQMVEWSIEDNVAQYQWGYKRYKVQPDGQSLYRKS